MAYYLVVRFDGEEDEDAQLMADDVENQITNAYHPSVTIYREGGFTVAGLKVNRE